MTLNPVEHPLDREQVCSRYDTGRQKERQQAPQVCREQQLIILEPIIKPSIWQAKVDIINLNTAVYRAAKQESGCDKALSKVQDM